MHTSAAMETARAPSTACSHTRTRAHARTRARAHVRTAHGTARHGGMCMRAHRQLTAVTPSPFARFFGTTCPLASKGAVIPHVPSVQPHLPCPAPSAEHAWTATQNTSQLRTCQLLVAVPPRSAERACTRLHAHARAVAVCRFAAAFAGRARRCSKI